MLLIRWMVDTFICIAIFSIAPLLDLRGRVKVVMDVLGEMIRSGFILARSLELLVQWDSILRAGPVHPVLLMIYCGYGKGSRLVS